LKNKEKGICFPAFAFFKSLEENTPGKRGDGLAGLLKSLLFKISVKHK
jgi:hypothetical protein